MPKCDYPSWSHSKDPLNNSVPKFAIATFYENENKRIFYTFVNDKKLVNRFVNEFVKWMSIFMGDKILSSKFQWYFLSAKNRFRFMNRKLCFYSVVKRFLSQQALCTRIKTKCFLLFYDLKLWLKIEQLWW